MNVVYSTDTWVVWGPTAQTNKLVMWISKQFLNYLSLLTQPNPNPTPLQWPVICYVFHDLCYVVVRFDKSCFNLKVWFKFYIFTLVSLLNPRILQTSSICSTSVYGFIKYVIIMKWSDHSTQSVWKTFVNSICQTRTKLKQKCWKYSSTCWNGHVVESDREKQS